MKKAYVKNSELLQSQNFRIEVPYHYKDNAGYKKDFDAISYSSWSLSDAKILHVKLLYDKSVIILECVNIFISNFNKEYCENLIFQYILLHPDKMLTNKMIKDIILKNVS